MTLTPWGRSEDLRARRLPPGPGTPRAEVQANQRERLYGAVVAAVAEHGYEKTRVADLVKISGVSRNAFYTLFDNKQDCVLATIEQVIELGGAVIGAIYANAALPWDERLRLVFEALVELIRAQPAAAHLCLVNAHGVGPDARERVEQIGDRIADTVNRALLDSPERAHMPHDLVWAILGGLRKVIHTRLRHDRVDELPELAPLLLAWALSYRNPSQPLRRLEHAPTPQPTPAEGKTPRERIVRAIAELVAENGYAALTITAIANRASTSLSTFYAEFAGKEEAVLTVLRYSMRQALDATLPAYQAAPDWPHAAGAAGRAFLEHISSQPAFVRLGFEVYNGGYQTILHREEMLVGAQAFLAEGYRLYPDTDAVVGEAIGAGVDELLYRQLENSGAASLREIAPTAIFFVLAPFVGVEEAAAVANGD